MQRKIFGIFIVTLLIGTAIPTIGMINEYQSTKYNTTQNVEYIPGEFIIKYSESPKSILSIENLKEKHRVYSTEKIFRNAEGTILDHIYRYKVPLDSDIFSIIEEFNNLDNVIYAEPNYISKMDFIPKTTSQFNDQYKNELGSLLIPDDPYFGLQYYLDNTGQANGTFDADIDAPEAWEIETGSGDIVIGFVDSGIDYTHPDLADNFWVNEDEIPDNGIDDDNNGFIDDVNGWDFVNSDNDPIDDCGHGTLCAGVTARGNNSIGIAGICWNCKLMNVKFADEAAMVYSIDTAYGMRYAADNGADIIITNIGFPRHPRIIEDAVDYAYDLGPVLIAPAGNFNNSEELSPAALKKVIGVAATDRNDTKAWFSNWGYWVDVAAAGFQTYTTMTTYNVYFNDEYGFELNYDYCGGTSFANPIVVGIAALLLSNDPTLTNDEVIKIIRANVDPYISDEYIGTGRVNAYKALTRYNTQPDDPETPSGKTNGKPGRKYSFTTSASDEDGDDLWYMWNWGDGNTSEWLGPYASGEECKASYTWQQEANFSIKVKVKDEKGGESYWSDEFIFKTPKNKIKTTTNLVWSDNFDSYELGEILGDNPEEDGGWEIWDDSKNKYTGGEVVDYFYRSPPHSLEMYGSRDILHPLTGLNNGNVTCSLWSYVPNNVNYGVVTVFGSYHEQGSPIDPLTPAAVQFDNTAGVIFDIFYKKYLPIITDQWVEIRLELNLEDDWYECYYNNELLVDAIWTVTNHGVAYRNFGFLDFCMGTHSVFFDDITVEWESTGLEPNLNGEGSFNWNVSAESYITDSFTLENIGDQDSWLEWKVVEYPDFGTWYCNPDRGMLKPEDGSITIEVRAQAPKQMNKEFTGELKIEVIGNPEDNVIIPVTLTTPKSKSFSDFHPFILRLIQRFSILEQLLL